MLVRTVARIIVTLPDEEVEILNALADQGLAHSRNALIQQIIHAFITDIREHRPRDNPRYMQSALGALVGAFLFGVGIAVLAEIFGGEN